MILGMEIGLAIFGILALVRGKMTISKTKVVVGVPARLLGLFALAPLPLAFMVGVLYALNAGPANAQQIGKDEQLTLALIEGGIVVGIAILVFAIGAVIAITPEEAERQERRTRYRDEDDFDDRDERDEDDFDDRDDRDDRRPWDRSR